MYASMAFQFSALRKPQWYIFNVMAISFLIVVASFSVFYIPDESISERLAILFT
jgi:hypothetical protein